jgi:phosphoribosylaminoimidazole-succinocarboxamide synthase
MMTTLPKEIGERSVIGSLAAHLHHQGKVRNTYLNPYDEAELIQQATDGISAFDFVFPVLIPKKGQVLTALTDFSRRTYLRDIPHHFVESGKYPGHNKAREIKDSHSDFPLESTFVIKRAKVLPYELIFRHHIGGSVWKEYLEKGTAGGNQLPSGLSKWQALDSPVYTPSTKEAEGHDKNITAQQFFQETGEEGKRAQQIFLSAYRKAYRYCHMLGVLILDTKGEIGYPIRDPEPGNLMIVDEAFTPDSSRYVLAPDLEQALHEGRDPDFYDKEIFRIWVKSIETPFFDSEGKRIRGINNLDPTNPQHVAFVHSLSVPQDVVMKTSKRYLDLLEFITGMTLEEYQAKYLL